MKPEIIPGKLARVRNRPEANLMLIITIAVYESGKQMNLKRVWPRLTLLLLLALALSACGTMATNQDPQSVQAGASRTSANALIGQWRHVSLLRTVDGNTAAIQSFGGNAIAEFLPNGTWTLAADNNISSGSYKWIDSDHIEQTILKSSFAVQIGFVSVKQIRVDQNKLDIVTVQSRAEIDKVMPALKPDERRPDEIIITSVFFRK